MPPINLDAPNPSIIAVNEPIVIVFITLQSVGFVGSSIVLATALFGKNVKRDGAWINLAISWVISSLSYLLLFISGQQFSKTPSFGICMVQASLVYSVPVLTAFTSLALGLQLLYRIRWALGKNPMGEGISRIRQRWFIVIPWVAFVLVLTEALIVGGYFSGSIGIESGMYCGILNGIPGRITAILVVLCMAVLLGVEIGALLKLVPVWSSFDRHTQVGTVSPRLMVVRLGIFSLFVVAAVIAGFAFISQFGAAQDPADVVLAILPVAFCVIFGVQKDMLNTWAFWKRTPSTSFAKDFPVAEPSTHSFAQDPFA